MPKKSVASAARPRGRPRNSDGQETAARLVEAAAHTCAERGFEGATMSAIAKRAGVTPAAIYNHFESREDLLYAAGVARLQQVTAVVPPDAGGDAARLIAAAYLRPEQAETRRLLAELHLAGGRDPRLAELLAAWHQAWAGTLQTILPPDDPHPEATVKALFLVLLGLCHLDHLQAVRVDADALAERVRAMVDVLVPPQG
jgi:AcrR family transcriptional regulator